MLPVSYVIQIVFITTLLAIAGCNSTPKPPVARISLNIQPTINPYTDGISKPEPRPVTIRIYELKSQTAFSTADYHSLTSHYKEILDNDLLNSEEFQLFPGKKFKFDRTLHPDTRFVGVVSAFRNLEHSRWRAMAALPPEESNPEIYVLLEGNQVSIGAKPACSFFCRLWSPDPPAGSLYEVIEHPAEESSLVSD
jgi:type VI secretion system protein VasD